MYMKKIFLDKKLKEYICESTNSLLKANPNMDVNSAKFSAEKDELKAKEFCEKIINL